MYRCLECGKQFEEPIVKGDLEEDIAVCPHCDSEWIKEIPNPCKTCKSPLDCPYLLPGGSK